MTSNALQRDVVVVTAIASKQAQKVAPTIRHDQRPSYPRTRGPISPHRYSVLIASGMAIVIAVAIVVAVHHRHWNTPLFIWGVAIGVGGVAQFESQFWIARRFVSPVQRSELTRQVASRRMVAAPGLAITGFAIGAVGAAFSVAWIDIALSVFAGAVWIASYGSIPWVIRRSKRAKGDSRRPARER